MRLILLIAVVIVAIPAGAQAKGLTGSAEVLFDGDERAHILVGTADGHVTHATEAALGRWSTGSLPATAYVPPALAFGDSGRGVVVWSELGDGVRVGSTEDPPTTMASLLDAAPAAPQVSAAVAGDGTALAAWSRGGQLVVATRSGSSGAWSRPTPLGPAADVTVARPLQLVRDAGGATIVWLEGGEHPRGQLWARHWSQTTRRWAPAVAVARPASSVAEFVAASGGGRVVVAWVGSDGVGLRERVAGTWHPVSRLASDAGRDPVVALGPADTGVAARSTVGRIVLARRTAGGWRAVPAPPQTADAVACEPAVALDEKHIVLAWVSVLGTHEGCPAGGYDPRRSSRLVTSVGRAGSGGVEWSPTVELDSDGHAPVLAASPGGRVALAWFRGGWSTAAATLLGPMDVWAAPVEVARTGGPPPAVDVGAPTLTDHGWRVRVVGAAGRGISARVMAVDPGRSWIRAARAVHGGLGSTDLQLGHLPPGTYRLFGVMTRAHDAPVIVDRVFTTHFRGLRLSVSGRRVSIVVPIPPRTGVGVRLESPGRRAPIARQSQSAGGSARTGQFVLGPVPPGRYRVRLTAVGSDRRRVQLERIVTVQ